MPRRRTILLAFLVSAIGTAHADGMLPDGSTLTFNRLFLHEDNSAEAMLPKKDPDSIWNYFNLAHCVCSFFNANPDTADPEFYEDTFQYEITLQNSMTPITQPLDIWVGTDCSNEDPQIREANCTQVDSISISEIQRTGVATVELSVYDVMTPRTSERPGCQQRVLAATTWGLADVDGNQMYDEFISDGIQTDSEPPPLPTNFRAVGAENAIELSWDAPTARATDIAYYQALCASTVSGGPGKTSGRPDPRYLTARQLCGAQQDVPLMASEISTGAATDAGTGSITLPEELAQLDSAFLCGETTSGTVTGMRIEGLENGTEYTVVLLAIDLYGNASGTYFTAPLVPQPATDFWEDLQDRGSDVEGGFCLVAQAYGDNNPLTQTLRGFRDSTLVDSAFGRWLVDVYYGTVGTLDLHGSLVLRAVVAIVLLPLVALALLWHLVTLPGLLILAALVCAVRYRRRFALARPAAAAATLALIVLVPAHASAQSPYWESNSVAADNDDELPIGDPRRVTWHTGIRVGPYVPGIDEQLGAPAYEQMFGGYSILPMLDIERFLAYPSGQLGVGVSIGYLGKKARPWQAGSDPADPMRPRSQGDENRFRLFPLSLNATYRFTYLDDAYGIPLIPYARAGLAYYIWWITAPDGDFAEACVDGGTTAMCETTTARGATLGFVGSIGLAIRAERIDGDAARSMRESGIEHAGFYAEYSLGKVDGFGSDKKLSVGDATWFAGVDFEF